MNREDLKEFIRRLDAEGLSFEPTPEGLGKVSDENGMSVSIENEGAILYKPADKPLAVKVMELYNQVREYMPAFRKASPDPIMQSRWLNDTRTLLLYNNCEFAANKFTDGSMQFITWRLDRNGTRDNGHYYNDYGDAKQDFAIRAELVNRGMLFSEKELMVIRSNLSDYLAMEDTFLTCSQEDAMKEVIRKIDNVIVPEIHQEAEEEEDLGFEPQQEL